MYFMGSFWSQKWLICKEKFMTDHLKRLYCNNLILCTVCYIITITSRPIFVCLTFIFLVFGFLTPIECHWYGVISFENVLPFFRKPQVSFFVETLDAALFSGWQDICSFDNDCFLLHIKFYYDPNLRLLNK